MTNLPPVTDPLVEGDTQSGHGESVQAAAAQQPDPWYVRYGYANEEEATKAFDHARRKISEQGRELNEIKRSQMAQSQPANSVEQPIKVTFDQFVENTGGVIESAAERAARKALSEYVQMQERERMFDDAARKEGVERWQIEETYDSIKNDPRKALEFVAAVAKMQHAGVQTDQIRQAVRESADNKARATQVTSTSTVVDDGQPDWDSMDYPTMLAEMRRRGISAPPIRE